MSPGDVIPSGAEGTDELAGAPAGLPSAAEESPSGTVPAGSAPDASPANAPAPDQGAPAEGVPTPASGPEQRESLSESFNLEEIFQDILQSLTPLLEKFIEALNGFLEELGISTGGGGA
jgi:hypothetical protein